MSLQIATETARVPVPARRTAPRPLKLVHVTTEEPGIARLRSGKGFRYVDAKGRRVEHTATLDRIRALVIPPAWSSVWISADAGGHIQAVGRDARGRKQYVYHAAFRDLRDRTKYRKLASFARSLPAIRERLAADLATRGLTREKVLATVVQLLEKTLIRIGNAEYARTTGSYGLTTLDERHVEIAGAEIRFVFRGKSGKEWNVRLRDRRLARIVRDCQDIPGQHLFQYRDESGRQHAITSADVNAYLRDISGSNITAKDFRTWAGTVLAATELATAEPPASATAEKRAIAAAIKAVSNRLGNTPTVCRACYVHPSVIAAYRNGRPVAVAAADTEPFADVGLSPQETAVLRFLERRASRQSAVESPR